MLAATVSIAKQIDRNSYADGAEKSAFDSALASAIEVLANRELSRADQESVDAAAAALRTATVNLKSAKIPNPHEQGAWKRLAGDDALGTMSAVAREGFESE